MIRRIREYRPKVPFRGFNDTDDQMNLPSEVIVDILNMDFTPTGLKTVDGYSEYSTSGLPTASITGAYVYNKKDGTKKLLVDSNTDVYVEGSTGVFSSIYTGLTAGYMGNYTTLADFAIRFDGTNQPLKYDGSNMLTLKIAKPTTAPSAAVGSSGNLTGDYMYKVTFVSKAGAETNPGPSTSIVSPSSQQVDLSAIPTGSAEVVSRKIYRTTAGGTAFYYLDTIPDNTTTTYTDNIADTSLGTTLAPTDHDDPPVGKFAEVYKEYLFVAGVSGEPTKVYFSHQSQPEIFKTSATTGYYLQIGLNDGQEIIGVRTLRNILYIFKESSTWPVSGITPDDMMTTSQPISNSYGLYHRSIATVTLNSGDVLVGLTKHGLYAFDGYTYRNIGYQPDVGINITGLINSLDPNKLDQAYGFNDLKNNRYILSVTEAGQSYNNKQIVWDYRLNTITVYDRKCNIMLDWNNNTLFGTSEATGKIYKIGGLNNAGSAITQRAEFTWWRIGGNQDVRFRFFNVDTTLQGNYSPSVTVYIDGDSISVPLNLYTADVTTSSSNTTFTATTVVDGSTWDLSNVVVGMFAVASGGSKGTITAVDDANNTLTVDNWDNGTPSGGEIVSVRGESWGSVAWSTLGGNYRVTKTLDIIGSDSVNLKGRNIKFKISHAGLNQPITLNGISLFYQPKRKIKRVEV